MVSVLRGIAGDGAFIVHRKLVLQLLGNAGISIHHSYVGNDFTSLEVLGADGHAHGS